MAVRGTPLGWTEDDVDAMSNVTMLQLNQAQAYWRANVPRAYRMALDGAGNERDIERGMEALIAHGEAVVADLTEAVTTGRMTVQDWQTAMAAEIVSTSLCALAAGLGGWANVTAADLERLRNGTEDADTT